MGISPHSSSAEHRAKVRWPTSWSWTCSRPRQNVLRSEPELTARPHACTAGKPALGEQGQQTPGFTEQQWADRMPSPRGRVSPPAPPSPHGKVPSAGPGRPPGCSQAKRQGKPWPSEEPKTQPVLEAAAGGQLSCFLSWGGPPVCRREPRPTAPAGARAATQVQSGARHGSGKFTSVAKPDTLVASLSQALGQLGGRGRAPSQLATPKSTRGREPTARGEDKGSGQVSPPTPWRAPLPPSRRSCGRPSPCRLRPRGRG